MIRTYCPICRTPFDVASSLVGQKGLCSSCGAKFLITLPDQEISVSDGRTTQPMNPNPSTIEPAGAKAFPTMAIALATFITVVTAAIFYWLKAATIPAGLLPWTSFLGEMHPLFVHFPVGWIVGIFTLGILGGAKNQHAIGILLWLNLLTCSAGIIAGQCFAADRAESVTLTRHLWTGLAVGGFSWLALCFFLVQQARGGGNPWPYRFCIFGAVASVTLAGHFGATLTHGELLDHLPWKVEERAQKAKQTQLLSAGLPVEDRTVLDAVVMPILQARCISCHGADKQKGELRLDSYESMMAVGESGKNSFVAANPDSSESLVRIALPVDDEDHMPPAKKPQMEPDEIEVLKWWVLAGADPKLKVKDAPAPENVKAKIKALAANPPKVSSTGDAK